MQATVAGINAFNHLEDKMGPRLTNGTLQHSAIRLLIRIQKVLKITIFVVIQRGFIHA